MKEQTISVLTVLLSPVSFHMKQVKMKSPQWPQKAKR